MKNYYNIKIIKVIIKKEKIRNACRKVILNKRRKSKGFTLIEIIAVIAIIGILSAAILPNVNGYIKEAKKVKVVDQCRKVVMAAESYKLKNNLLEEVKTVSYMKATAGLSKYLDKNSLKNLPEDTTLSECRAIVNGGEFDIEGDNDMLKTETITNTTSLSQKNE
ncbi:hypothetical protein psyc5s11_03920 [Clostridium gelidum]|uniref:Uncharacterized protein n=1 Tax=Clostridium gelidum TaxID=704125 RepID=A0ABM7SXG1_9CLOT|nr:prepilin-type N-terminal cleavage/methylation domain-containing protein [Clostridium gelidum]BCZ44325.1 hypothetical protein psyc5s11_03920 [Clostridium gelidum]